MTIFNMKEYFSAFTNFLKLLRIDWTDVIGKGSGINR